MIRLRLFTHPICHGCTEALAVAQRLAGENPEVVELEVISLATPRGRALAQEAGVVIVPTLEIDGERLGGVPSLDELRQRIQRLTAQGGLR